MRTSVRHAKHVKPALHPTRSTLSAGLTAVLLPLCMASPALAQSAPVSEPSATSTATIDDPEASPSPSPAASDPSRRSAGSSKELPPTVASAAPSRAASRRAAHASSAR